MCVSTRCLEGVVFMKKKLSVDERSVRGVNGLLYMFVAGRCVLDRRKM